MTYEDWVPLTMGPKIIGKARIDLESGAIEGKLDPEFAHILNDGLPHGVADVSFTGRAGIHAPRAQKNLKEWLEEEPEDDS